MSEKCAEELRNKGAWSAIKYSDKKLRSKVQEISGRHGADIVFETVGGEFFESAIHRYNIILVSIIYIYKRTFIAICFICLCLFFITKCYSRYNVRSCLWNT